MIDLLAHYSHELAVAGAILLTAVSQVMLRFGARNRATALSTVVNPGTVAGYALFGVVILLMIFAMQKIPLRTVIAWNSLTFVLTPLAGNLVLKDPLTPRMVAGALVIVAGVVVFSL